MQSPSPITIAQIAKAAGVGTATVDRVLNDRAGVNPETARRVKEVLASLGGATPQPGRPKTAPSYRFAFVLPNTRSAFFDAVDRVVAQSAGEFRHQHITELTLRMPAHDPNAFAEELTKLTDYRGLAVLAPDVPQIKLAISELVQSGVQVISLFSDVTSSMRAAFLGADNRSAGRTAGLLLGRGMLSTGPLRAALFSPPTRYSAEIDRRIGFTQILEERFPQVEIKRFLEVPETEEGAYQYAMDCLAPADSADALGAVYNVANGGYGIAKALSERGYRDNKALFAVHDLVEVHRTLVASGAVDYVLHQDIYVSVSAAARTLRALSDGVRGALTTFKNPRIEIITPENLL